jgi:hypothetical protein
MRTHYLPKYYLSGFAQDSKSAIIWTYEKGKKEPFAAQLDQVAIEKNLYPKDFEEYLADEIEQPANLVLRKIREGKMISVEDKIVLSRYMTVMLKRVPRGMQRFKEKAPHVIDKLKVEIDSQLAARAEQSPAKAELIKKRREEAQQILQRFKESPPKEAWISAIKPEMTPRVAELLSQMTWQFFVCEKPSAFLTCDNPVFFFECIGIGKAISEVSFPISSYIALWATWRSDLEEGFFPVNQKWVYEINRRTAKIASRFVFSHKKQAWIVRLVNKKAHKLSRIIR